MSDDIILTVTSLLDDVIVSHALSITVHWNHELITVSSAAFTLKEDELITVSSAAFTLKEDELITLSEGPPAGGVCEL